jgi:hypothetical protein
MDGGFVRLKGGVMKKILILLLCCLCIGCSKLKGDKGDAGTNGTNGQDAMLIDYSGSMTSDPWSIKVKELKLNRMPLINVYVSNMFTEWVEVPFYIPINGSNVFATLTEGYVMIYYAYQNGLTKYYITVAEYPDVSKVNRLY